MIFSERRRSCAWPIPWSRRSRCQARKQPGPKSRGPNPNRSGQGDHHPNNGRGTNQKSCIKKDTRNGKQITHKKRAKGRATWRWWRKAAKAPHHQKAAPQEVPLKTLRDIHSPHLHGKEISTGMSALPAEPWERNLCTILGLVPSG